MPALVARHPVPFRFVARRGGPEAVAHRHAHTPVSLVDVDPRNVERACLHERGFGAPIEWLAMGGSLWTRCQGALPGAVRPGTAALFRDVLAGRADIEAVNLSGMGEHLRGTPVVPLPGRHGPLCRHDLAFEPRDEDLARSFDDMEREARAAFEAFVEEDVRTCGDDVLFRACPLACLSGEEVESGFHLVPFGPGTVSTAPVCRIDRTDECVGALTGFPSAGPPDVELARLVASLPGHLLDDGDLRHLANRGPAAALAALREIRAPVPAEAKALSGDLLRLAALGGIGAIPPARWAESSAATARFIDTWLGWAVSRPPRAARVRARMLEALHGAYVPARRAEVDREPVDAADMEAMSGMGP